MRSTRLAFMTLVLSAAAWAAPYTMQGVQVGEGGTLAVRELPVPKPGAGEVLIKVRAAGVNPVDWKAAGTRMGQVPGTDVSGVIDTLGDGVSGWKVGEQVLGFARQSGSYAEYAVIPVSSLARKPKALSFEEAAGVPIAAETAYRALHEAGGIKSGQTVLIHGAAGGVGSAAVQIAKAAGARVIGTASANNLEFLKSIGADQVNLINAVSSAESLGLRFTESRLPEQTEFTDLIEVQVGTGDNVAVVGNQKISPSDLSAAVTTTFDTQRQQLVTPRDVTLR